MAAPSYCYGSFSDSFRVRRPVGSLLRSWYGPFWTRKRDTSTKPTTEFKTTAVLPCVAVRTTSPLPQQQCVRAVFKSQTTLGSNKMALFPWIPTIKKQKQQECCEKALFRQVVYFDRGHSCLRNANSTFPTDALRVYQ